MISSLRFVHLALFAAFVFTACGGGDGSQGSSGKSGGAGRRVTGESLYRRQQCIQCHGVGGQGMPGMGPALRDLSQHWTRETLDEYLLDPQAVSAKSDRLGKSTYRMKMPPVRGIADGARAKLLDYILTL